MTKLNKRVARETDIEIDNKKLFVELLPTNIIFLRIKGRSKGLSISIEDLYSQLSGENKTIVTSVDHGDEEEPKKYPSGMFSLHEFRTKYLVNSDIPIEIKTKLENTICKLINQK